jgi:hypothetical protein
LIRFGIDRPSGRYLLEVKGLSKSYEGAGAIDN